MYSMASGTTKLLEAPANQGWILISLDEIETDDLPDDNPIVPSLRQQLAQALRGEYTEQFTKAIREDMGVETNEDALEAVRTQLAGGQL